MLIQLTFGMFEMQKDSCRLVYEDAEGGLFTVTLFRKAVDDYKQKCRDKK